MDNYEAFPVYVFGVGLGLFMASGISLLLSFVGESNTLVMFAPFGLGVLALIGGFTMLRTR